MEGLKIEEEMGVNEKKKNQKRCSFYFVFNTKQGFGGPLLPLSGRRGVFPYQIEWTFIRSG
jgi:hypothetical protein